MPSAGPVKRWSTARSIRRRSLPRRCRLRRSLPSSSVWRVVKASSSRLPVAKMRAAVLYDVDDIRIEERDVPKIGDGELLVQTRASGICTGDVMGWYIRRKAPLVLGHEPAGVV